MRSTGWPHPPPLQVGPVQSGACADDVHTVVGQFAIRAGAGAGHGEIGELGRRLLLMLEPDEEVYAASTVHLPDHNHAIVIATDRRLLGSAGLNPRWDLNAPWGQLQGARVTAKKYDVIFELLVDGVILKLTGKPALGAAPLVALAAHILAAR